ncbi:MAG TPA: phosphate acyltransferase PlsX [Acidimicrobiia bacterium]|jgi:glycerol-3-phosphate acyltransferase PlsX|nr:phosphate acyltransferase PlsX [Acidimicrobiia bacterium]HIL47315.1 phosphate acyltransferase PlsX [Acidimicrobiia bacterium]
MTTSLPIAVDAMGGDRAPSEIVAGARLAKENHGIDVVLVGRSEELTDCGDLEVIEASEVIAMDAEPGSSVRRLKDSSLVRAAEAVRDGRASAMVSAGNTGATMASALLRMGRIKGVSRPAIATLLPAPGTTPTVLLDAGANAECKPEWLAQFGQMGAVFAQDRLNISSPRVGLLSIGEEPGKGSPLVKETYAEMQTVNWGAAEFIGNVEGRDLLTDEVDVVVTDGFTGNVALKTLEGALKNLMLALFSAMGERPEATEAAAQLGPEFDQIYRFFHPDTYGGAMLLGVKGVCVISHGSSGAHAMENAIKVAAEMVETKVVDHLTKAIAG